MAIIDVDCPPTLKEIAAQDSEQSDTYSASDRYIWHMIIYGLFKLHMHDRGILPAIKALCSFQSFCSLPLAFPILTYSLLCSLDRARAVGWEQLPEVQRRNAFGS